MTNETKIQAQVIFNAIMAMSAAYEQMHGEENYLFLYCLKIP